MSEPTLVIRLPGGMVIRVPGTGDGVGEAREVLAALYVERERRLPDGSVLVVHERVQVDPFSFRLMTEAELPPVLLARDRVTGSAVPWRPTLA